MTDLPFHRNTPSDKNNIHHFEENAVRGGNVETKTKTIFNHDFHLKVPIGYFDIKLRHYINGINRFQWLMILTWFRQVTFDFFRQNQVRYKVTVKFISYLSEFQYKLWFLFYFTKYLFDIFQDDLYNTWIINMTFIVIIVQFLFFKDIDGS